MSQAPRCLSSDAGQSMFPLSRGRALSLVRFVCGLPRFQTAAMSLGSPLVRPYGRASKRSVAGASRLLLECLGPLGIIHIINTSTSLGSLTGVIAVTPLVLTPSANGTVTEPPRWIPRYFAGGLLLRDDNKEIAEVWVMVYTSVSLYVRVVLFERDCW